MSIGRSQDLKVSVALPHSYPAGALRPLNSALASHLCTLLRTPVCAISCSAWFACTQEMRRAFSRKKSTQGVNAAPKPSGASSAARGRKRSSSRGRKPRALPSIGDVLESALRRGLAAKAEADEERASEKAERAVQRASRAAARSRTPSPSAPVPRLLPSSASSWKSKGLCRTNSSADAPGHRRRGPTRPSSLTSVRICAGVLFRRRWQGS